ncbi:MAG: hypothetical protein WEA09_01800 [Gemmatimonadota bacterium]
MRAARSLLVRVSPLLGVLVFGTFLYLAGQSAGDLREVVSSEISVAGSESSLRLEFRDGNDVEVVFRSGQVMVDGREEGSFTQGGVLDTAWRSLLGQAVALDNGSIARVFQEWSPPADLEDQESSLAARLDQLLEEALQTSPPSPQPPQNPGSLTALDGIPLGALLSRAHRLPALAEALEGLSLEEVRVEVGRSVSVDEGEQVDGSLIVVDGDVDVRGEVMEHLVVVGGELRLHPESRVGGDVRLSHGTAGLRDGRVGGSFRNLGTTDTSFSPEAEEAQEESRAEARDRAADDRDEARDRARSRTTRTGSGFLSPLRHVGAGLAGLLQTLLSFAIISGLGLLVRHFFPQHLERVSQTARHAPGRSAMVGLAGVVLFFPAWVVGAVVLAISIVGIPLLLIWLPALPLALAAGGLLGFLAVARLVGEWVTEREVPGLEWARSSNEVHILVVGVGSLLAALAAAHVIQMGGPLLGFLRILLHLLSGLVMFGAVITGLGAVLLSRAGREEHVGGSRYSWDDDPTTTQEA